MTFRSLVGAARAAACMSALAMLWAVPAARAETLSHGLFKDIELTRPAGEVNRVVLLLGEGQATATSGAALAKSMVASGAMVARIDAPSFLTRLAGEGGACSFADGALENLAHHLEAVQKLPTYMAPVLVGLGDGAALAYAVQAQAAVGTFSGALSIGFCPVLDVKLPLCPGKGLKAAARTDPPGIELLPGSRLGAPWTALQAEGDATCGPQAAQPFGTGAPPSQLISTPAPTAGDADLAAWLPAFKSAYATLTVAAPVVLPLPASLSDLPIVEVPSSVAGDRFAVLLSGDGGWAGIDKGVAKALAAAGVPVAGFDSLRYFWSARTPQGLADDLDRTIRYYAARWNRREVMLIGYSQGADVMPFAINRLPPLTRAKIQSTVLLGPGQKASFEFHVSNWIGPSGDKPIAPEAARLRAATTLCVYGSNEKDSLCPRLSPATTRVLALKGDHHFGGDYDKLAALILANTAGAR